MASRPPSFFGGNAPRITRLPMPSDSAAPLVEGVDAVGRAVVQAEQLDRATDERVRESDLQVDRLLHARDLQRRQSGAAAEIATLSGALQVDLIKMRSEAEPGAEGHEQRVEDRITKFKDAAAGLVGADPDMVTAFTDNIASIAANARVGEAGFAAKASAEKSVADGDTLRESLATQLFTKGIGGEAAATNLTSAFDLWDRYVDAQLIPGNAKEQLRKEGRQSFVLRAAEGSAQFNPDAIIAAIDGGQFNASGLSDDQLIALRKQAVVVSSQRASAAAAAANEGSELQRAEARTLIEDVGAGVMVDTKTLLTHLARAKAGTSAADVNLAHDLEVALAKNEVTAQYDHAPQAERRSAMREIEATKDWQKNNQLVAAHSQLTALIGRDDREAVHDTLGLYVRQTGAELPPANIADPKSMAPRWAAGDRAAQRYNRPPSYLFEEEAKQLQDQWNNGTPAARAEMVETLARYGANKGRAIMRQFAPNKPEFARLVELASLRDPAAKALSREALDGWSQPMKGGTAERVDAAARRQLAQLIPTMPGDRRDALFAVARGIYAHRAVQRGQEGFDPALASESVEAALGKVGGTGGIGGAPNGDRFIVPMGASADDFAKIWAGTSPQEFRGASNGVPKWTNGQDLTVAQFKQLTPVLVYDDVGMTVYAFRSRGGSGFVKTATGQDYLVDFRKVVAQIRSRPR